MRKFLVYICSALILCNSAAAYWGSYSAYDLYQLASSGDFRSLQNAVSGRGNINAEDSNGQTAICYAITNRDFVAYKNLVMMRANEHPRCVDRMYKQDYEDFKRGYELRGGKVSSSFSLSGSTVAWTVAGVAAVGAGVAIAAGGGGGGGGGSSSSSDTPTPAPTQECTSFNLNACPDNANCLECIGSTRSFYKMIGCQAGYKMNQYNTGCIVDTDITDDYPLHECDANGVCESAMVGSVRMYRLISCNTGYEMSTDKLSCNKICPGFTQESCGKSEYISGYCDGHNDYHKCTERTNTEHCNSYQDDADKCTSCYGERWELKDGKCEQMCKGLTNNPCDNKLQYTTDICEGYPDFHKCVNRTNTKGCAGYDTYSDTCTGCEIGYNLKDGKCEEICPGYTQDSCTETQYISGRCEGHEDYHICTERAHYTGCMQTVPDADKCVSCLSGYKIDDNGYCNQICEGYTKQPCTKATHYISDYCVDDDNYHKCTQRSVTDGCLEYVADKDLCASCQAGYEMQSGICVSNCPGYTMDPCDTLEYISETCNLDPAFHKCEARQNTHACASYDTNKDWCTSCEDGYELVNHVCMDICPEYTNKTCPINEEYESDYCQKDPSYHHCYKRTNKIGCTKFSKTSDTCTECDGEISIPVDGKCSCDGHYTDECDLEKQYISAECPTAAGYHICTNRKNTDGCLSYEDKADKCTSCVNNTHYLPESGICTKREHTEGCKDYEITEDKCTSCIRDSYYLPQSGDNKGICTERIYKEGCKIFDAYNDACEECEKEDYYLPASGICTKRENKDHCKTYDTNSDKCLTCEDDYKVSDGFCVAMCQGYQKEACEVNTYYAKTDCPDESDIKDETLKRYRRCVERDQIEGCTTYSVNANTCKKCDSDHTLNGEGLCDKNSALCPGYTKDTCNVETQYMPVDTIDGIKPTCEYDESFHRCISREVTGCKTYNPNYDKCASCETGYKLDEDGKCVQLCPGMQKEACDNTHYYTGDTCEDDPNYHECKVRNNVINCTEFNPSEDKCTDCKDGFEVTEDGKCNQICVGYKKECGTGWHIAKDANGNPITCSAEHPDYYKCELDPDAAVIPGCKVYTEDKQKCQTCEDWYTLSGDAKTCTFANTKSYGCAQPVVNQDCCSKCDEKSKKVEGDSCKCEDDPRYDGGDGGDSGSCTTKACQSGYHEDTADCEDGKHKCVKDDEDWPSSCKELNEKSATGDYGTATIVRGGRTIVVKYKGPSCNAYKTLCGGGTGFPDGYGNDTNVFNVKRGDSWTEGATPPSSRATVWNADKTDYYCGASADSDLTKDEHAYINHACRNKEGDDNSTLYKCAYRNEMYRNNCKEWVPNSMACAKCEGDYELDTTAEDIYPHCVCKKSGGCSGDTPHTEDECKPLSELGTCPMDKNYYNQGGVCTGETALSCDARQNTSGCTSYDFYADKCTKCADGYGEGNNTGSNKANSDGKCPKQSSGEDDEHCKDNCSDYEYEDQQQTTSECNGKHYCLPRVVSLNCKDVNPYDDKCKSCDTMYSESSTPDERGVCIISGSSCTTPTECLAKSGSDNKNYYYIMADSSYGLTNIHPYYSYCTDWDANKAACIARKNNNITNCVKYSAISDGCSECKMEGAKCYGIVKGTKCLADEHGLCDGNEGFEPPTSSSRVVKLFEVTDDQKRGQTVFVAQSNTLDTFNAAIAQYNGYKTDTTMKINITGEHANGVDVTGAINVHNGSENGGTGTIEITRDDDASAIKGAVKGLVGGNNYKGSEVLIDVDVKDGKQGDKRSFIAGMGKEVGAYQSGNKEELDGIDLGSAAYGQHNRTLTNAGKVSITANADAPVFGMLGLRHAGNVEKHSENQDLGDFENTETGVIDVNAPNAAEAYGIKVNNIINKDGTGSKFSTVTNAGKINVSGGSNVYGIAAKNANVYNEGEINVTASGNNAYGIHADHSNVENNGSINITAAKADNAYGIYASNGSIVKNNGIININGSESADNAADGKFIHTDANSYVINAKTIISSSAINTYALGGDNFLMTTGGNISAPEVSGTLNLSSYVTSGSNGDVYIMRNLVNGDTQDLSVVSQSAMFSAALNDYGSSADAVLTRNSFNDILENGSLADYLEANYTSGNGTALFDDLKAIQSLAELRKGVDDLLGKDMFSRLTFEDMSMLREVSLDMSHNMFKQEGAFSFGGNVSPSSYSENDSGSIGRYALNGFNYGKTSYGFGVAISDVNSYDDNQDNYRKDRSFVFSAPIGRKVRGFEFVTSPKIGYAYGTYTRNGFNSSYNGKVYKRMYALMNEARYPMDIGKMKFTPSAEFNMIGFNVKGSEDANRPYNLRIPSQTHYSVEAGLGFMIEKEFSLYKYHFFRFNTGLAAYHEFANPYELDIRMSDLDGTYRLHDEKHRSNRAVARFGFDYDWKNNIGISANVLTNIDGDCRTDAVCDFKYRF